MKILLILVLSLILSLGYSQYVYGPKDIENDGFITLKIEEAKSLPNLYSITYPYNRDNILITNKKNKNSWSIDLGQHFVVSYTEHTPFRIDKVKEILYKKGFWYSGYDERHQILMNKNFTAWISRKEGETIIYYFHHYSH